MKMLSPAALAALAVVALAVPASAGQIPDGTVSSAHLFTANVNVSGDPGTYGTINGTTFQTNATGGFASAQGATGTLNGTISFSETTGTTLSASLNNLFVFNDGSGGTFNFSATSVQTIDFSNNPGVRTAGTLYLLGTTLDSNLGYSPTNTSLTLTFNSTGGSAYSSSSTLAVPPSQAIPEPASMALVGTGIAALAIARRRKTAA